MKIKLERNFYPTQVRFRCAICEEFSIANAIRPLLCHDDGAIVGDICLYCLNQPLELAQARLRHRAVKLTRGDRSALGDRTLSPQEFATELRELSEQPLAKPPIYVWWWQRFKIAIAQACELESARAGKSCLRRSQSLKITFLNEEPSIDN